MSFLFPLYLLAGAAVVGPIILHLIRRHTKEYRPFSSLMFLTPSPPRIQRRSRLENITLLLLRCAALILLAIAFTRPFFASPTETPEATIGRRIVVLIDRSASMQRESLWNDAKQRAQDRFDDVEPTDHVAIYTFDRQTRPVLTFDQWKRTDAAQRVATARTAIEALEPSWAATDIGQALVTAADAIEDDESEDAASTGERQIVLISDLQDGATLDALHTFAWPETIDVTLDSVGAKKATNAGVQLVFDADGVPTEKDTAQPRVRVTNAADAGSEQFRVRWKDSAPTPDGAGAAPVYVPPGHSRVVRAPATPAGIVGQAIVVEGDDHAFDNTLHVAPLTPQRINIVYVGDDRATDSSGTLFYLHRALSKTALQTPNIVARTLGDDLSGFDANAVHLMVINGGLSAANVDAVRRYVDTGRTALLLLRDNAAAATAAQLLGVDTLPVTESTPGSRGGYAMLSQLDFTHPLLSVFDDPRFRDFTKIHFWRYRSIPVDALPDAASVVARFDNPDAAVADEDAPPAWIEAPIGGGRLLILASGWNPDDSQLALSSKFVPLLYSILERSGGLRSHRLQYAVGDPIPLDGFDAGGDARLTITRPDGATVEVPARGAYTGADTPGIYRVAGPRLRMEFAVNVHPSESRTAPLPAEKLEQAGVTLEGTRVADADVEESQRQLRRTELESRQKIWRWAIVAALCFLMAETWLAGRLARPTATANADTDSADTEDADTTSGEGPAS